MILSEFKIGEIFWCSGKQFKCTDVGTRTVIAIRIDAVEVSYTVGEKTISKMIANEQAQKEGWFNGPPFPVAEVVFDSYDLPACTTTRE